MNALTIAVIGHVDHGKTLLVRALTGIDTDTLKDEKTRGLSIALGFAALNADDYKLHLIDAPGHEDFTRMTASGLSGASAILLVVSARDGIQKQTIEHIKLAHLFGIQSAVVAITKSDLIEANETNSLRNEIASLLSEFEFGKSEIVDVSGRTRAGMDQLVRALTALARSLTQPPVLNGFFLPVDRVFSADGAGTIVTGTLLGGSLHIDDQVSLLPSGKIASVRGLQIDGTAVDGARIGARIAVNLRATESTEIRKGEVVCAPGAFFAAKRFDVRLTPPSVIKHMQRVEVLHGTAHAAARVRLYPTEATSPLYAQLEFEKPQVAYRGQRFVLREPASRQTLTGGTILDNDAGSMPRNKATQISILKATDKGDAVEIAHRLADRDLGLVDTSTLSRLHPKPYQLGDAFEVLNADMFARVSDREALQSKILSTLRERHAKRPCKPFIDTREVSRVLRPAAEDLVESAFDQLVHIKKIRARHTGIALAEHDPLEVMLLDQRNLYAAIEARSKAFGLKPQNLFETPTEEEWDLLECLIWKGRILRLYNHSLKQTIVLHTDTVTEAHRRLTQEFSDKQRFSTSAAREALATNRKTIVPLLEYFDEIGCTKRIGNARTVVSDVFPADS